MASQYSFGEYSATWPAAFEQEASRLQGLFGETMTLASDARPGTRLKGPSDGRQSSLAGRLLSTHQPVAAKLD